MNGPNLVDRKVFAGLCEDAFGFEVGEFGVGLVLESQDCTAFVEIPNPALESSKTTAVLANHSLPKSGDVDGF